MANSDKKNSGLWAWIILAIVVACTCVAIFYYIGWFDTKTHVDTPAGDDVLTTYTIDEADADAPGEADWQNAEGQSFEEVVTEPASQTETPPAGE